MRTPLGQATIADLVSDVASPSDGDRLIAVAWRGGFPVTGDLEVASFSLSWDGGRKVQGQATVEIVDPDGTLTPFNLDDPLAAGGSRLKLVYHYGVSGNQVDLGWWRIRHPEAHMTWQPYRRGAAEYWMSGSGGITVQADEETATVDLHLLNFNERVSVSTTVLDEARRLIAESGVAHTTHSSVTNTSMPKGAVEYSENRLDAVEELLKKVGAGHRMTAKGELEIVPLSGVATRWVVALGEGGALVEAIPQVSDSQLVNQVTATGQTPTGTDLVAQARITDGPLAWGGPFGKVPTFVESVATTQSGVQADADRELATLCSKGDVTVSVDCLTNPALQIHDLIEIQVPAIPEPVTMTGRVSSIGYGSTGDGGAAISKQMTITVEVPTAHVTAARTSNLSQ